MTIEECEKKIEHLEVAITCMENANYDQFTKLNEAKSEISTLKSKNAELQSAITDLLAAATSLTRALN